MFDPLFPMTVNNVKNNFIKHMMRRESTWCVNRIITHHPEIQTSYQLYVYLRNLSIDSPEIHIFENAYDEHIATL